MAMNVKDQVITENYAAFNGDCVEVMKALPSDSIHLSIYSLRSVACITTAATNAICLIVVITNSFLSITPTS